MNFIERIFVVLGIFLFILHGLYWIIKYILIVILWFIVNTIDLLLVLPMCLVWVFSGKMYIFQLSRWVEKNTKIFNNF
jgi:hypothetical protein